MSGALEGIVRPFQISDIGPPKTALQGGLGSSTSTANQPENTIINPGKDGQVKSFSGSFNLTITYYYIKKPKEKKAPEGQQAGQSEGQGPSPLNP